MKRIAVALFLITVLLSLNSEMILSEEKAYKNGVDQEKLHIFNNAIAIPPGNFLIARKGNEYCAVKILEVWKPGDLYKSYSIIETYYQGDSSGEFSRSNVQYNKEKIRGPRAGGCRLIYHYWDVDFISCKGFSLIWSTPDVVYFPETKELVGKIEMAPTMWRDVSEINLSDPRLKWYRIDVERRPLAIPIKEYWKEPGE